MVVALAAYQVILAAIGYGKLRLMDARPAFFTHRASGDALVVVAAVVALMCVAVYGFDEGLHAAAGVALAVVLLALTWLTAAPGFLAGED